MSTNRFAPADWLLDYLDGQEHEKISTTFGELARYCDFSAKELQRAGFMLREIGLITMMSGAGHSLFVGGLTGEGQALVYSGQSVGDYLRARSGSSTTTNTVNVTGDIHGGQVGINSEQTITVQVTPEQVRNLVSALREDGLTEVADAVEEETRGGKEPARVMDGLRQGLSVASDTGTVLTSLGMAGKALLAMFGAI